MRTNEIIRTILEIVDMYKFSPFTNIYIRFYIDNKLFDTFTVKKGYGFSYKGVCFGNNLICLLVNNLHFDYFNYYICDFVKGKINCHGHGEFFGIDKLVITFKRGDLI